MFMRERSSEIMIPDPLLAISQTLDTSLFVIFFLVIIKFKIPNICLLIKLIFGFITRSECLKTTPVSWRHKIVCLLL
jgi:hypothetical protein